LDKRGGVMYEVKSLGIVVGTGKCNANCAHCAGVPLRKYAPKKDGEIDSRKIYQTIKNCYEMGARAISLTGSGEPTLSPVSVTKVLKLIRELNYEGIVFPKINLYSNGIRIGEEKEFCDEYLSLWREFGLRNIQLTVHSADEKENARLYGVKNYPPLKKIVERIHCADLTIRANLVIGKKLINSLDKFAYTVSTLSDLPVDAISSWQVRGMDDKIDLEESLSEVEIGKIRDWIKQNQSFKCPVRFLGEENQTKYETGEKLTLFQNGKLSNSWCN
jgi:molybdenum cofactor biosynthesis enzyme MoaA